MNAWTGPTLSATASSASAKARMDEARPVEAPCPGASGATTLNPAASIGGASVAAARKAARSQGDGPRRGRRTGRVDPPRTGAAGPGTLDGTSGASGETNRTFVLFSGE